MLLFVKRLCFYNKINKNELFSAWLRLTALCGVISLGVKKNQSSYFATDSTHSLCSVVIAICHELCRLVSPSNPCGTILSKHYRSCLQISKSALKQVTRGRAAGHRICWEADCDKLLLSSVCLYTLLSPPPGDSDLSMTPIYTERLCQDIASGRPAIRPFVIDETEVGR